MADQPPTAQENKPASTRGRRNRTPVPRAGTVPLTLGALQNIAATGAPPSDGLAAMVDTHKRGNSRESGSPSASPTPPPQPLKMLKIENAPAPPPEFSPNETMDSLPDNASLRVSYRPDKVVEIATHEAMIELRYIGQVPLPNFTPESLNPSVIVQKVCRAGMAHAAITNLALKISLPGSNWMATVHINHRFMCSDLLSWAANPQSTSTKALFWATEPSGRVVRVDFFNPSF